jgi:hypothetical protein
MPSPKKIARGVVQGVEHLLCKFKALKPQIHPPPKIKNIELKSLPNSLL